MKATKLISKIGSMAVIMAFLGMISCESNAKKSESTLSVVQTAKQEPLVISDVQVDLVKLDYKFQQDSISYDTAWLIRLQIHNMPIYRDSGIEFFIGDEKIREYGGTEDGIYFKVYEKEMLNRMADAEIRYKLDVSGDIMYSKVRFKLPNLDDLKMINEKELLKRGN